MPPIVLIPPHNGSTTGASYNFSPTNAHGIHPFNNGITQWKVTVTTAQSNGGSVVTQTGWVSGPNISTVQMNGLPANNNYYYTQILYQTSSGQFVSSSNKFQSRP